MKKLTLLLTGICILGTVGFGQVRKVRPVQVPVIEFGQEAPDFNLPKLNFVEENGKKIGKVSSEMVKLSSFRGKKPVVLIFTSYT
ncbi:MAG: hypothetical protein JEZ07_11675 [Phycisphaerae bacterium]|nr:hypothetical protein [Phycisphaerae bacterium]